MKKNIYIFTNDEDGNRIFEVAAFNIDEARAIFISQMGWNGPSFYDEDEDDGFKEYSPSDPRYI